ncbi:MAG: HDIG domain-containing protein [candidate division WOR-3 bacterium]|nr:HDIG domain-containing protein [candidate division WOR-3 bacterium]
MVTAKSIEELFHDQLSSIENEDTRKQTIATWVEAAKQGGWKTVEDLKAMPFTLLTKTHGISLVEHTIAVTEGALALADAQESAYSTMPYKVNMDRLIAGGLLHDVGKLLETEKDEKGGFRKSLKGMYARHPISGAILAAKCGLPEDIVNTIACHAKEGEGAPKVLETVLIHQADFATFDPLVMLEKGQLIP